jgi:hypothetical protein
LTHNSHFNLTPQTLRLSNSPPPLSFRRGDAESSRLNGVVGVRLRNSNGTLTFLLQFEKRRGEAIQSNPRFTKTFQTHVRCEPRIFPHLSPLAKGRRVFKFEDGYWGEVKEIASYNGWPCQSLRYLETGRLSNTLRPKSLLR